MHHPLMETGIPFMDGIGLENAKELEEDLINAVDDFVLVAGNVHGAPHGMLDRRRVTTAVVICSAFSLDVRANAPIGFQRSDELCRH